MPQLTELVVSNVVDGWGHSHDVQEWWCSDTLPMNRAIHSDAGCKKPSSYVSADMDRWCWKARGFGTKRGYLPVN